MKAFSKLLVAVLSVLALMGIGSIASADHVGDGTELDHTGQGTNPDGTCEDVRGEPDSGQIWHFVLTGQTQSPADARIDASFDDGTTVTDLGPTDTPGQTAHFFVTTSFGAALLSATAHFDGAQAGANPQFVVSHCETTELPPPDDDDKKEDDDDRVDDEVEDEAPTPAPAVVVQPTVTG